MADCPFCARVATEDYDSWFPAEETGDYVLGAVTFEPLSPVVPGHRLVVPVRHVRDALEDPWTTARAMFVAAEVAALHSMVDCNIIANVGRWGGQSVFHLHVHLVPRVRGDGLKMPWSGQEQRHD
jgi:histidine triad (HIT) family protein